MIEVTISGILDEGNHKTHKTIHSEFVDTSVPSGININMDYLLNQFDNLSAVNLKLTAHPKREPQSPQIDWSQIDYDWIAWDEDGLCYQYKAKPTQYECGKWDTPGYGCAGLSIYNDFWQRNWRDSLMKRPESELLPCPFCGGKADEQTLMVTNIKCAECGIGTGLPLPRNEAIEKWNNRQGVATSPEFEPDWSQAPDWAVGYLVQARWMSGDARIQLVAGQAKTDWEQAYQRPAPTIDDLMTKLRELEWITDNNHCSPELIKEVIEMVKKMKESS